MATNENLDFTVSSFNGLQWACCHDSRTGPQNPSPPEGEGGAPEQRDRAPGEGGFLVLRPLSIHPRNKPVGPRLVRRIFRKSRAQNLLFVMHSEDLTAKSAERDRCRPGLYKLQHESKRSDPFRGIKRMANASVRSRCDERSRLRQDAESVSQPNENPHRRYGAHGYQRRGEDFRARRDHRTRQDKECQLRVAS